MRYDVTVAGTIVRGEAEIRGGLCIDYDIDEALYLGERHFPAGQLWTLRRDRHDEIVAAIEEQHRERYGDDDEAAHGDRPDNEPDGLHAGGQEDAHNDRPDGANRDRHTPQGVPATSTSQGGQTMSDATQGPDFDTSHGRPVIVLYTGKDPGGEPERLTLGYRKAAAVCDQIGHIRAFVERCRRTGDNR